MTAEDTADFSNTADLPRHNCPILGDNKILPRCYERVIVEYTNGTTEEQMRPKGYKCPFCDGFQEL